MTQTPLQTGHDAPVNARSEDFYDRWPIAKSISHIIETAPPQWSTRIGLFGQWGDGKTSVLNFVEQQQLAAGNIVIKYAPWGASTPDEVWRDFGKALISGLERHNAKVGLLTRGWHYAKGVGTKPIKAGVEGAGMAVEKLAQLPGAEAGGKFASSLISDKLAFTADDIRRLTKHLGSRKVVVFIDDLDRTDPSVVPKLLLVLRELLDFAQFAFVLAFDQRIVAATIKSSHQGWEGAGENFLDKVIDFRVDLPKPTVDQVRRLGLDQFGKLCPFVPQEAVEGVSKLLPANPRKLKLLARMIASTRNEVMRHEAEELDWSVILLSALLRTESESLANRLIPITIEIDEEYGIWEAYEDAGDDGGKKRERERERLKSLLDEFPELRARSERIELLVKAWDAKMPKFPEERIRYQASFALTPHCITWGEYKQFLGQWRSDKCAAVVTEFVKERMDASGARSESVQTELTDSVLGHYATVLESAGDVQSTAKHRSLVDECSDSLDLLLQCAASQQPVCVLQKGQLKKLWEQLYTIAAQWRHFTSNEGEVELRAKEVQSLIDLGKAISDPLWVYDKLSPARPQDDYPGERDGVLRREMVESLLVVFAPEARREALLYVSVPGRLKLIRPSAARFTGRYLLTSPRSPLCSTYKADLMSAWEARRKTPEVVDDATDYLFFLLSSLDDGDRLVCSADERKAFIRDSPEFMCLLWSLCVSEPSQYRMLKGLRDQREKLVAAGIPDASLVHPDWLKVVAPELRSQTGLM